MPDSSDRCGDELRISRPLRLLERGARVDECAGDVDLEQADCALEGEDPYRADIVADRLDQRLLAEPD